MYIHTYIYTEIQTYKHTYIHIYTYRQTYIHTYIHRKKQTRKHTNMHTRNFTCSNTDTPNIHTWAHMFPCTDVPGGGKGSAAGATGEQPAVAPDHGDLLWHWFKKLLRADASARASHAAICVLDEVELRVGMPSFYGEVACTACSAHVEQWRLVCRSLLSSSNRFWHSDFKFAVSQAGRPKMANRNIRSKGKMPVRRRLVDTAPKFRKQHRSGQSWPSMPHRVP